MMRIITGKARGIRLDTLEGEETRPTSERVKEAVFSMLQFDIEGRCVLDLFAGSGQMGLEAVSRGAISATMVDKSKNALKIIERNTKKTGLYEQCEIKNSDSLDFIRRNKGKKYDIIFIDPPYASGLYRPILRALYEYDMLKPSSLLVCESNYEEIFEKDRELEKLYSIKKIAKYSKTVITILEVTPKVSSIAIVPGSFDPITCGHIDVIKRAAREYDTVYVAVMINNEKNYLFSIEQRTEIARAATKDIPNVEVISSEGMLWELALSLRANAIVKGYRNAVDLDYERKMAEYNDNRCPAKTVLLKADDSLIDVSSTAVRRKISSGEPLDDIVPAAAIQIINKIMNELKH